MIRRLFLIVAALAMLSCTEGGDPTSIGDQSAAIGDTPDAGACARPEYGCACEPGSAPVDCYSDPVVTDTGIECTVGTRSCEGGTWGECVAERSYTREMTEEIAALIDGPDNCNACNPDCKLYRDYPVTRDLTGMNSDDVSYDAARGGLILGEAGGGGSAMLPDRDGDGVPDVADDYPSDPRRTGVEGGFYHTLEYGGPAATDPFSFGTRVTTADVYVLMDTTGSMGGEIDNLKRDLTSGTFDRSCEAGRGGGLIGAIRCTIPNAWFGVGNFDDYPRSPYGSSSHGDVVYRNFQDLTSSTSAAQSAVNRLRRHYGRDWAESQSQALWATATGGGLCGYLDRRRGCASGRWGYPCFRDSTIPIILMFTDAPFHNGPSGSYRYAAFGGGPTLPRATPVSGNQNRFTARYTGDAATTYTSWSGRTCGMTNEYNDVGCNGQYSPDAVFRFTMSRRQRITLTMEGSAYNTVLSVYNSSWSRVTCNDDHSSLGSNLSKIEVTLDPGTYYAVVDGYGRRYRASERYVCGYDPERYCSRYAYRTERYSCGTERYGCGTERYSCGTYACGSERYSCGTESYRYACGTMRERYACGTESYRYTCGTESYRYSCGTESYRYTCGTESYRYSCGTESYRYACGTYRDRYACGTESYRYTCGTESYRYSCGTESYRYTCGTESYRYTCGTESYRYACGTYTERYACGYYYRYEPYRTVCSYRDERYACGTYRRYEPYRTVCSYRDERYACGTYRRYEPYRAVCSYRDERYACGTYRRYEPYRTVCSYRTETYACGTYRTYERYSYTARERYSYRVRVAYRYVRYYRTERYHCGYTYQRQSYRYACGRERYSYACGRYSYRYACGTSCYYRTTSYRYACGRSCRRVCGGWWGRRCSYSCSTRYCTGYRRTRVCSTRYCTGYRTRYCTGYRTRYCTGYRYVRVPRYCTRRIPVYGTGYRYETRYAYRYVTRYAYRWVTRTRYCTRRVPVYCTRYRWVTYTRYCTRRVPVYCTRYRWVTYTRYCTRRVPVYCTRYRWVTHTRYCTRRVPVYCTRYRYNRYTRYCNRTLTRYCTGTRPRYCTGYRPRYCTGTRTRYCTGTRPRYCTGTRTRYCERTLTRYCTGTRTRYCTGYRPRYCTGTRTRYCTGTRPRYCTGTRTRYCERDVTRYCTGTRTRYCTRPTYCTRYCERTRYCTRTRYCSRNVRYCASYATRNVPRYCSRLVWREVPSCGNYRFTIGTSDYSPCPVTWSQTVDALRSRDVRVISIDSGGSSQSRNDCRALGTATNSVDARGNPYYFRISSSGTGLGRAVVDAVENLANNTRYDVSARAVDNPATAIDERGFVDAIRAISYPSGRCTGKTSTTFQNCLPGTNVNFNVSFRNDIVMPTMVAQVFNFHMEVLMDGTVQKRIPVRITVPPDLPRYPETGSYWRNYDSTTSCGPRQRPDWGTMTYSTSTPGTTAVEFQLRTANTAGELDRASPVAYRIPPKPDRGSFDIGAYLVSGGRLNYLPHLRVTALLRSSTDREETPTMTGFEVRFTCVDIE